MIVDKNLTFVFTKRKNIIFFNKVARTGEQTRDLLLFTLILPRLYHWAPTAPKNVLFDYMTIFDIFL
jgi:hypothetical protein